MYVESRQGQGLAVPFQGIKAGEHHFQAGDVLIFKGQWKNVDYWPETKGEEEEMGRERF